MNALGGGDNDLADIVHALERTLTPDKTSRDRGETELRKAQIQYGFAGKLLRIIATGTPNMQSIRLAAAVALKNYVKKHWPTPETSDGEFVVPEIDRNMLKDQLVPLMFSCPEFIQKQIGETINLIAWTDFPAKWPNLLPTLVQAFSGQANMEVTLGALRTCHGLFKHYRDAFATQGLHQEIRFVLETFATPFTTLFNNSLNQIGPFAQAAQGGQDATAKAGLENLFHIILLCCKIFQSLISQELPDEFVGTLSDWMTKFNSLLVYENSELRSDNDEEPGVLNNVKSVICAILTLMTTKYDEDFHPFMETFALSVWSLLQKTTQLMQDDLLVFNALEFLSKAISAFKYKQLFMNPPDTLNVICEQIIVPNVQFRQSDREIFTDNPEEFIRRDIEGSDTHTRRHAAGDLVRAALKHFGDAVTTNLSNRIQACIQAYNQSPTQNWKEKDAALFLFTAVAAVGQTSRHGITAINPLMSPMLESFTVQHVYPHFQDQSQTGDKEKDNILRAACLKFIVTFRAQLPRNVLLTLLPEIVRHLQSDNSVVYTYAAHCIERVFTTKDLTTGLFAVPPTDIQPTVVSTLLANLVPARRLAPPDALNPEGVLEENEYVMKCIMRTLSYLQEQTLPHLEGVVQGLVERLRFAIRNPGQPKYDHYLFESLALCIRNACTKAPQAVAVFEAHMFPLIELVLKDNVDAFFPYVFQLLAEMLEYHSGTIPPQYMALLDFLLKPELVKEYESCVPAVVRLISAFFNVNATQIDDSRLNVCFGMIRHLLSRKKLDLEGFTLLRAVVEAYSSQSERLRLPLIEIFRAIFQRLTSSKTDKFVKGLNSFVFLMIVRMGPDYFIEVVERVQTGIFGMLMDRIVLSELGKVSRTTARRLCIVGGTMLLTKSNAVLGGQYDVVWTPTLEKLVELLELPPEKEVDDTHSFDLSNDEPVAAGSVSTTQSQLVFAKKPEKDIVADLGDLRIYLAGQLAGAATTKPGMVSRKIQGCNEGVQRVLQTYCQAAGVTIS